MLSIEQPMLDSKPQFVNIVERFTELNRNYHNNIGLIEEKLHSLSNMRNPAESDGKIKNEIEQPNDFAGHINDQLQSLERGNNRLFTVLEHLQKLV